MYRMANDTENTPISLISIVTRQQGARIIEEYAVCEYEGETFHVDLTDLVPIG